MEENAAAALFGNRFATQEVPSRVFPDDGMPAVGAMRLVAEDLAIEGDPARNLATFVTTWMEPQAQRFAANSAWVICAAITHNLLRAAGSLASPAHAVARGATL